MTIQNTTYRAFPEKLGDSNPTEFVGDEGELFWDPNIGQVKVSDGVTPGGLGQYSRSQLFAAPPVKFVAEPTPEDVPVPVDYIDEGVALTRPGNGYGGGLYNPLQEDGWSSGSSPEGTEWNSDGWGDLSNVADRSYTTFYDALDNSIGQNIINSQYSELVMHDTINDKYYKFEFHHWQAGSSYGNGYNDYEVDHFGGFSYTRQLIHLPNETEFVRDSGDDDTVDEIAPGLTIKRNSSGGGIYNVAAEEEWNPNISPSGTLWNVEGWDDLTNITEREYNNLLSVTGSLGSYIEDKDYVMWDTINDEYYKVKFTNWEQIGGGAFTYTRTKLNKYGASGALRFGDGTAQTTAIAKEKDATLVYNGGPRVAVGNGDSHLIDNFSGLLIVNDHDDGGVQLWICGGGEASFVGGTNVGVGTGTVTMQSSGYEWANTDNLGGPFTFTAIKTRNEA